MKSVNAVTIKELYDLSHTEAKPLMEQYTYCLLYTSDAADE